MTKRWWAAVAAIVMAAVIGYGVSVSAQPGDANDPLVSKRYVDAKFDELLATVTGSLLIGTNNSSASLSQADRDAIVAEVLAQLNVTSQTGRDLFTAVRVEKGQTLIGGLSAEIILRSGNAVVVSGVNGLCDMTAGVDITNGMNVSRNHLLIVPAADGRGLYCTTEAYLIVKGDYYVQ